MFQIGPTYGDLINNIKLGCLNINWNDQLKYLGIHFTDGKKLSAEFSGKMSKYYAAVNSIVCHTKDIDEIFRLNLHESDVCLCSITITKRYYSKNSQLNKLNGC